MRIFGPQREQTCLLGLANNTGADQPAHPRSLISAFVIRFVKRIKCKLATGETIFWPIPVAEGTSLKLALSETPKTGFVRGPFYVWYFFSEFVAQCLRMCFMSPGYSLMTALYRLRNNVCLEREFIDRQYTQGNEKQSSNSIN